MDAVMWLIMFSVPLSLGLAVWLLISGPSTARAAVASNLARGHQSVTLPAAVRQAPAMSADTKPSFLLKLTPAGWAEKTMAKLARAGVVDDRLTPDRILLAKFAAAVLVALVLVWLSDSFGQMLVLFSPLGAAGGWFLPELLIHNAALKRRESVDLELPDILDQMSIAVSAGLGFDAAMMRVARSSKGALPKEFIRTLQDMQLGKTRAEAFEDLAGRTGSAPLRKFTRAIVSAGKYGMPVTVVLHQQADELRDIRRQNAEKKAGSIPVKVTIPLMMFILPTVFIIMMGPPIAGMIEMF